MIINISGKEFNIDPWWRWVSINDNGEVSAFGDKPSFEYWNGYKYGRFWSIKYENGCRCWGHIGLIDENLVPRESLVKLIKINEI